MAQYEKYAITAQRLTGIADAIREKKKTTDLLTPEQMVAEIRGIESGSPSAAEVTFGYVNNVPVEREINYSITSESLNNIAKRTQEMAGTTKLMTPEDIIYWLDRVKFIPQSTATSEFTLEFEAGADSRLPTVIKGTATSEFTLPFAASAMG